MVTVSRARKVLQEIGGKNSPDVSRESAEVLPHGLAEFATHYTMQSQRDVHQGVTAPTSGSTAEAIKAAENG